MNLSDTQTIKAFTEFQRLFMVQQYIMNSNTNLLIVMCCFPEGNSSLLWKISWLCSTPADALTLGVVNVSKIIQRSSLPNLQHAHHIFTDRNHRDDGCNYILKIHRHISFSCLHADWTLWKSRDFYTEKHHPNVTHLINHGPCNIQMSLATNDSFPISS